MIQQLQIIIYSGNSRPWRKEVFDNPNYELVLAKLTTMDRHYRPLLYLCKTAGTDSENVLEVMGGDGLYFIEATDDRGFWYTPFDAFGSTERIDIWTSDQGNSVEAKYTWPLDDAKSIVEYYFRTGNMLFAYDWKSVKHM